MSNAPILLTPGPLTTSIRTRQAMLVDWGSWDRDFNQLTASVCEQLLAIIDGSASHHCVPLQGSGTFAVEAAIGTLVPRDGKVLVLINGAYGQRLAKICKVLGRTYSTFETAEDQPTTAADVDRLLGLEIGADDYICKPFQPREVVARIRALLRRAHDWSEGTRDVALTFDDAALQARWKGVRLDLTAVEYRLMKKLAERPGRVLSRANLLDAIYEDYRIVNDRTVDSHIKNLRRKLAEAEDGANPIESVYGVGYRYLGDNG